MATEIAEPADLPAGAIDDTTASRYRMIVYQQAQDDAGIKTLGLADWKNYLNFNGVAVDNVATFVGIDVNEYNYRATTLQPLPEGVLNIVSRIANLVANTGVPDTPQSSYTTLNDRTTTLEGYVKDGWTDETRPAGQQHVDGLLTRADNAESNIEELWENVGGGGGSPSNTLTSRVQALETTVGDSNSGLVQDTNTLKTEMGSGYDQSKGDVSTRLNTLETNVGTEESGGTAATGMYARLKTLDDDVGTSGYDLANKGTVSARLDRIEEVEGVPSNYDVSTSGTLLGRIETVESVAGAAYSYKGTVVSVVNDSTPVTEKLILENSSEVILADLGAGQNGNIYNISPASGNYIEIIFPVGVTTKYQKGANIAWVWDADTSSGHFDELGSSIDVQSIETDIQNLQEDVQDLQTDVSNLKAKFKNNGSSPTSAWNSTGLSGIFLIVGRKPHTSPTETDFNDKVESFIGYFGNGICYVHNDIQIASPSDVFNFNDGTGGSYKVSAIDSSVLVNITQIG